MRLLTTTCAVLAGCGILICTSAFGGAGVGTANASRSQPQKATSVKTNFVAEAVLTPAEVSQVVSLARQCGIREPGEVSTLYCLPGGGKIVAVTSVEQVTGADITYDEITIGKIGWTDMEVSRKARKVGNFWAAPSDKFTMHF